MLTVLILFSGCGHAKTQKEQTPEIDVAQPVVDSIVLHKTYPGTLSSLDKVDVVARVNGEVLAKYYTSGEYVHKGQKLFTIESTKYRDAVQRAEAALATAKSQYEYASKNAEAMRKALESDAVSKMEVVQAESAMKEAAANIKDCQAALNIARTNLGYCTVTAPISGYTSPSSTDIGNYVSGENSPVQLLTIYKNDVFVATFNIEDSQYEDLLGQTGGIKNSIYRSIPLKFKHNLPHSYSSDLYFVSPSVNSQTGTLALKGTVKSIANELKDGMYVTVSLPYGVDPKAVMIKDASIGTDQLGKYVYVVNDSNKVVYTPIKVGDLYQDSLRQVLEGLTPSDRYVTKALLTVRSGETVKPVLKK